MDARILPTERSCTLTPKRRLISSRKSTDGGAVGFGELRVLEGDAAQGGGERSQAVLRPDWVWRSHLGNVLKHASTNDWVP